MDGTHEVPARSSRVAQVVERSPFGSPVLRISRGKGQGTVQSNQRLLGLSLQCQQFPLDPPRMIHRVVKSQGATHAFFRPLQLVCVVTYLVASGQPLRSVRPILRASLGQIRTVLKESLDTSADALSGKQFPQSPILLVTDAEQETRFR